MEKIPEERLEITPVEKAPEISRVPPPEVLQEIIDQINQGEEPGISESDDKESPRTHH